VDSTLKSNTIYRHMHPRTFYFYMCQFSSIPDSTTTQPTVPFPLTISIYWRVSHFLNVLNITHCSKHELDVDIIVRETKIWKVLLLAYLGMFVVLLICMSFSTILGSMMMQPTNFCCLYVYRPKSIACSRCLNTKLHISSKLT